MRSHLLLAAALGLLSAVHGSPSLKGSELQQRFKHWATTTQWQPDASRGETFESAYTNFAVNEQEALRIQKFDDSAEYGATIFSHIGAQEFRNTRLMRMYMVSIYVCIYLHASLGSAPCETPRTTQHALALHVCMYVCLHGALNGQPS